MTSKQGIWCSGLLLLTMGANTFAQHQHAGDMVIGVSGGPNPRLRLEIDASILSGVNVLTPDAIGGASTDEPGFDALSEDEMDEGLFAMVAGAQIWLQIDSVTADPGLGDLRIDPALLVLDPLFLTFYPYEDGGTLYREVFLGNHRLHKHVLWFVDLLDPAFDPAQCAWSLTARLIDKGSTGYAASQPFTLRFALHPLVRGDFDCDGDVDADDVGLFTDCHSGPAIPFDAGCEPYDLDGDNDVDSTDFAMLQRCLDKL